jgi:asparagine synthetase B (glutamine-hydrolysing)
MPIHAVAMQDPNPQIQVTTSPFDGEADFSGLAGLDMVRPPLDPVSMADLLRNAFVYPPHSIYRDVKVASFGFDPAQNLHNDAGHLFSFAYRATPAPQRPPPQAVDKDRLVETYHHRLCEAVASSTTGIRAPWLLQSGGKDSTSLAIAAAEARPQTTCLTYLGGREEDEVASARYVAQQLGLRHEALVCDPARAYDRYLAMVPRMPLLSADFALLSCADLVTEIAAGGGDGVLDGSGSDLYFGTPVGTQQRILTWLARDMNVPPRVFESGLVSRSFRACFALSTLGMDAFERYYPGSRFTDAEVDSLLGRPLAAESRRRLETFAGEIAAAETPEGRRRLSMAITHAGAIFAKGQYTASALGLRLAYPYCDRHLSDWVYRAVPEEYLMDRRGHNKVLVRAHIARRFGDLPYVKAKGCFRFDLCGLAHARFDQVHAYAVETRDLVPGAVAWLEANRHRFDNKFFASKFYLLAITLPWLHSRSRRPG